MILIVLASVGMPIPIQFSFSILFFYKSKIEGDKFYSRVKGKLLDIAPLLRQHFSSNIKVIIDNPDIKKLGGCPIVYYEDIKHEFELNSRLSISCKGFTLLKVYSHLKV